MSAPIVPWAEEEEGEEHRDDEEGLAVGDKVTIFLSDQEFKDFRTGDLTKEVNELKAGEEATISFANVEYGNYKVKREEDGKELFWFLSNELMAKVCLDKMEMVQAKKDLELQKQVDAAKSEEETAHEKKMKATMKGRASGAGDESDEDEDEDHGADDIHKDLGEDQPPALTWHKLTSELVEELFVHTKSIGARADVLRMVTALAWRCKLPFNFGRFHISVVEERKGETMLRKLYDPQPPK